MNKWIFVLAIFVFACANEQEQEAPQVEDTLPEMNTFAAKVEMTHQKKAFQAREAVQFDLLLKFGDRERLKGQMTLSTDSGYGLIEKTNGDKIYYVKDKVYYTPSIENSKAVRFDAYTWSYFFLFPYKLTDAGTKWQDYPRDSLNGVLYEAEKLTFKSGTGDAPDDWYIAYANEKNQLLEVAAYIVTANKTKAQAEEDPHAIEYLNYQNVEGIPIATNWRFRTWRTEGGLTDTLGEATLSNIRFVEVEEGLFTPPTDFSEI